jgi:CHAT domain-containing protein
MLREHQTPAQALRAAQQWMRQQKAWQSPYYWAGFILQGEWK